MITHATLPRPDLPEMFSVFGRIGVLSFGGPAAQIALMHRELVEDRPWLSEEEFLRALSFCMMLPGPEAMQLATYCGWRQRGVAGGLLAGLLFVLPGAVVILALALIYAAVGAVPLVQALFSGIKATVIVIVLQALWRLSGKALKRKGNLWVAGFAFMALFAFSVPFPVVVLAAGLWGYFQGQPNADQPPAPAVQHNLFPTILFWGSVWLLPLLALHLSGQVFLTDLGLFFSKLAVVTFGGAYAVLAYMTQAVVETHGWLGTPQMIDALGLAETTPGPLILVTEFVGVLAGHGIAGWGMAVAAGLVSLWMTFTPCFLWIFAGAPYIEGLSARPRLSAALASITAAVVGVIANLSLWFVLHVWFSSVTSWDMGPVSLPAPEFASFAPVQIGLSLVAALLLLALRLNLFLVLAAMATAGAVVSLI